MIDITTLALKLNHYSNIEELMEKENIQLSEAEINHVKQKFFELKSQEQYIFGLS